MINLKLRELLRNDFWKYIRNRLILSECEVCGSANNLNLHHIDRFQNMLMETLTELQLNELDIECYDDFELQCIRNFMLAKQIKSNYKTLCEGCHRYIHIKESKSDVYKDFYYNPYGRFVYLNLNKLLSLNVKPAYIFHIIYILTFQKFNSNKLCIKQKNRIYKYITFENISEYLNIEKTLCARIKKIMKDNNIVKTDSENNVLLNPEYGYMGFNKGDNFIKVFQDTFREFYTNTPPRQCKPVSYLLILLEKYNNNLIEESKSNIDEVLKFKDKNAFNHMIHSINNIDDKVFNKYDKNKYYISPKLIYCGELNNNLKEIENLIYDTELKNEYK